MQRTLLPLSCVVALIAAPSVSRACTDLDGPATTPNDGWALLLLLGVTTTVCVSSTTTAAALEGKSSNDAPQPSAAERRYHRLVEFLKVNTASLRRDAAVAHGEYLDAYLRLFGCGTPTPEARAAITAHYNEIFQSTEPTRILGETERALRAGGAAASCGIPVEETGI